MAPKVARQDRGIGGRRQDVSHRYSRCADARRSRDRACVRGPGRAGTRDRACRRRRNRLDLEEKIMTISRLVHHAHLVWRTERIIAELRLRRLLASLGLQALAALMMGFALLMIELAAYFALVEVWSAITSA